MRLFYHIAIPISLGLFLSAFIPAKMLPPIAGFGEEQMYRGAMEEYIEHIEGVWLSEERMSEWDEPDRLWIEVRRTWIYRDKVYLKVSEYCRQGMAEYLVFELVGNKLQYVAAKEGNHIFPLIYLDFMEISYEKEEGETVLYFESCEAEMENHLNRRFLRIEETELAPSTLL